MKVKTNHPNVQIPQVRSVEDQTKHAAVKIQQQQPHWPDCQGQGERVSKVFALSNTIGSKSWSKRRRRHPKVMCTAVGAGSPALAEKEGEGLANQRLGAAALDDFAMCSCALTRHPTFTLHEQQRARHVGMMRNAFRQTGCAIRGSRVRNVVSAPCPSRFRSKRARS